MILMDTPLPNVNLSYSEHNIPGDDITLNILVILTKLISVLMLSSIQ